MTASILAFVTAYISTNTDDIFLLMILLASSRGTAKRITGHCFSVGILTAISMPGALGVFILLDSGLFG